MTCSEYCCNHGCNQGRECPYRPATVTRIKASHPRDIDLPITLEPTLFERFAMSWLTPLTCVAACFAFAVLIAYAVR